MTITVQVAPDVWGDWRFQALAQALGVEMVADAVGRMTWLWWWCKSNGTAVAPLRVVEAHLGPLGPSAIVDAGLADELEPGCYHVHGVEQRLAELERWRGQRSNAGKLRAAAAKRKGGRFTTSGPLVGAGSQSGTSEAPASTSGSLVDMGGALQSTSGPLVGAGGPLVETGNDADKPTSGNQRTSTSTDQKERRPGHRAGAPAIPAVPTPQHGARTAGYGQPDPVQTLARRACGEALWNAHQAARKALGVLLGQETRDLPVTDQGRRLLQERIAELTLEMPLSQAERVCRDVLERTVAESERDKTLRYLTGTLWDKRRFDTTYALVGTPVERARKPINGSHPTGSGIGAMFAEIFEREAKGET